MEVGGPLGWSVGGGGGGTPTNNRVGEPGTGCPSSRGFAHARNPNTSYYGQNSTGYGGDALLGSLSLLCIWASRVSSTRERAIVVLCWRSSEPGARTKKQVLRADT